MILHEPQRLGTSVITSDRTLILAPRALREYGLRQGDEILLYSTGEGKVSLIRLADASATLFHSYVPQMLEHNRIYGHKGIIMAITRVSSYGLSLNPEFSLAFRLHKGERFSTVLSSDKSLSLIPIKEKTGRLPYRQEMPDLGFQAIPC